VSRRHISTPEEEITSRQKSIISQQESIIQRQKSIISQQEAIIRRQKSIIPPSKSIIYRQKSTSLRQKSITPRQKSNIPQQKSIIPRQKTITPRQKSIIPRQKSIIPQQKSIVPRQKSTISRQKSIIPRQKTITPRQKSIIPREKSIIPRQKSIMARQKSTISRQKSIIPRQKSIIIQRQRSITPRQTSIIPRQKITLFRQKSLNPRQQSISSRQKSIIPRQQQIIPRRKSIIPRQKSIIFRQKLITPQHRSSRVTLPYRIPSRNSITRMRSKTKAIPINRIHRPIQKSKIPGRIPQRRTATPNLRNSFGISLPELLEFDNEVELNSPTPINMSPKIKKSLFTRGLGSYVLSHHATPVYTMKDLNRLDQATKKPFYVAESEEEVAEDLLNENNDDDAETGLPDNASQTTQKYKQKMAAERRGVDRSQLNRNVLPSRHNNHVSPTHNSRAVARSAVVAANMIRTALQTELGINDPVILPSPDPYKLLEKNLKDRSNANHGSTL